MGMGTKGRGDGDCNNAAPSQRSPRQLLGQGRTGQHSRAGTACHQHHQLQQAPECMSSTEMRGSSEHPSRMQSGTHAGSKLT